MKSKKIFVMKTRPGISDEEIQSMMDFNKVLDVHRSARKKGKMLLTTGIVGGSIVVLLILWQLVKSPGQKQDVVQQPMAVAQDSTSAKDNEIDNEIDNKAKTEPVQEPVAKKGEKNTSAVVKGETKQPVVAAPVYTEAEPVNGYPDLYTWFQKELKYPVEARKDSIEGIVSVSFVINKEGKPEQIHILNSLGKLFDEEVVRVITNMPEWKPASLNGNPVPARLSMPLTFQINRSSKQ